MLHGKLQTSEYSHSKPQTSIKLSHGKPQTSEPLHGKPQTSEFSHGKLQTSEFSRGKPQLSEFSSGIRTGSLSLKARKDTSIVHQPNCP